MIADCLRSAIFISAVLFSLGTYAAQPGELQSDGSDNMRIQVQGGFLTVASQNVPLSTLLRAIGEEAGFEVTIEGDLDSAVDRSFSDVPLVQGLRRLLDRNSFLMFFDESENLRELRVLAAAEGGGEQPLQPIVSTVADPSQADLEIWILDRLTSPQRDTRIVAVRRLVRLEPGTAVNIAVGILASELDPIVRGQTIATLGKIGGDRVPGLLASALTDEQASVRKHAIRAWQAVGAEQAIAALGSVLTEDSDREVRLMALQALIEINNDSSRDYLLLATTDQDESIRQTANHALEANQNPAAYKGDESESDAQIPGTQ
jgi:HEAT repeat protein